MMGGMVNGSGPNVQTQALRPESCKGFIETSRDVTECSGTAWQGESAGECSRNESQNYSQIIQKQGLKRH